MAVTFILPRTQTWVTEQNEPGTDAKDIIEARFNEIATLVTDAKSDFDNSISALEAARADVEASPISLSGVSVPDLSEEIPSFSEVFDGVFDATLEDFVADYEEPTGMPEYSGEWEDSPVALESSLVAKVGEWLVGGVSAIPEALFAQMYNAAMSIHAEKRNAAIVALEAEAAARFFDNPSGIDWYRRSQIEAEYQRGSSEISAKIAERDMELTQANFHKAVEVANAYVSAAKDYVLRKNLAKVEWYKTAMDAWVSRVNAQIAVLDARTKAFSGKVEAFKAKALVFETHGKIFSNKADVYVASISGIKAKLDAIAEIVKLRISVYDSETKAAIESERLNVDAQKANSDFVIEKFKTLSALHGQVLAGALSATHVQGGMSVSHSTGQQVGYNYSRSENLSEQHSEAESVTTSV